MSVWATRAIEHVERAASGPPLDRSHRVTLNFHPDRVVAGATVLERLARDGVYRSQFETGTSNGGLTARPGGARWRWEQRIFGHAYDDAPAAERPKYGALNHRRRRIGAAPRFGSAHLRLTGSVLARSTFCFPDSVLEPTDVATADSFGLFPLVERFDARRRTDAEEAAEGGLLDDYVEAHVHGVVDLTVDVEALVLDPASGVRRSRSRQERSLCLSSGTRDACCTCPPSTPTRTSVVRASSRWATASLATGGSTPPSSAHRR